MGLNYPTQKVYTVIGTTSGTTRSSIALTNAYQAESGFTKPTKAFECGGFSKVNIDLLYTLGATETANSIEVKSESSPDGTNYYHIPNDSTTTGVSTITEREFTFVGATATAAYPIGIPLDIFYKYLRISIKETGVASNVGTIHGIVTLSGK